MSNDVRNSMVAWLYTQPLWTQKAAEKILKKEEITEKNLNELLDCLKSEDGQKIGQLVDFSFFSQIVEDGVTLKIKSIGDIHGIDNLAPRTPLNFGDNLSVIYGNNGSGKSGYTRILKKSCGKNNALDLISNVFKEAPTEKKCAISFNINGQETTTEWKANTAPIPQLQGVDIFDSSSDGAYLNGETEATYMPIEVMLFERLVWIFDSLKQRLDKSAAALSSKLPTKPSEFGQSKYIDAMYTHLKHNSDQEKLKIFFEFTSSDDITLKSLEERIKTAPSELAKQKIQRKNQITGLLDSISNSSVLVTQAFCDEVETLKKDVETKKQATLDAAKVLADNSKLQGIGEQTWKSMWLAAKKYSEEVAYNGISYPNVAKDSVCVLCHQDLSESAKARMTSFGEYIQGQLQSDLQKSENLYQQKLTSLPQIPSEESLKTAIQACQLDEAKWLPIIKETWLKIEAVKKKLTEKQDEKVVGFPYDKSIFTEIETIKNRLDEEILTHTKDGESFDLKKAQQELNDLKSKKWASSYLNVMLEEITRLKELNQIEAWAKQAGTSALSKKAGEVSEKILTEAYVERFNNELKALGANKISVELIKARTGKGKVKHKLQLKNVNQAFSKIQLNPLSEGERRIISLAAFLADVMGKSHKAPFVFDDPISSLDQIYEERTAQRLIDLSKDRQVIVFTHRLSLLGLLSADSHTKHIRREQWGCGEHSDIPLFASNPISAVKNLKNERLAQAKKLRTSSGSDTYNILAKAICSDFRILLERIIEQELLGGIIQRHKRKVTTDGKLKNLSKIQKKDCELLEGLMTEYSKYEHSQSDEAPVELPSPEDIEKTLDSVISWQSEFSKRALA
ncbi:MAG: restriction endonuclease [Bdellovibrio sp.]|nr:restriction endonuclease [Bdellovibrio sp.]